MRDFDFDLFPLGSTGTKSTGKVLGVQRRGPRGGVPRSPPRGGGRQRCARGVRAGARGLWDDRRRVEGVHRDPPPQGALGSHFKFQVFGI